MRGDQDRRRRVCVLARVCVREQNKREDDACWIPASTIILLCTSWLQPAHGAAAQQYSCRVNSIFHSLMTVRKVDFHNSPAERSKRHASTTLITDADCPDNGLHFPLPPLWKHLFIYLSDNVQQMDSHKVCEDICAAAGITEQPFAFALPVPPPYKWLGCSAAAAAAAHESQCKHTKAFSAVVFTWIGWTR